MLGVRHQQANRTDSAVRAAHRPTGLTTNSQDQRSQHANKRIARLKLTMMLADQCLKNGAGLRAKRIASSPRHVATSDGVTDLNR
ncbi:peptide chain release factor-like protein [Flavisphingomonas formosensis]|uniref:peptide chain release factor-like protein n=1 Tax=Flavisphingomonas formosensis TaxID=861534 RepID=UPI001E4BF297|nr:peptide chain release factor-like protein [Sphingomonas formosensis]